MKLKELLQIGVLLLLLVLVRVFQYNLFYDPLTDYYKGNYLISQFPEIAVLKYFLNVLFRYFLNK